MLKRKDKIELYKTIMVHEDTVMRRGNDNWYVCFINNDLGISLNFDWTERAVGVSHFKTNSSSCIEMTGEDLYYRNKMVRYITNKHKKKQENIFSSIVNLLKRQ